MKKKWLIPAVIAAVVILLAGGIGAYMGANSMSFSTGRCIVTRSGSYLILLDDAPVVMSNRSGNEAAFSGLQTGDEILILHDGIQETYPGGTGVYYCKKLENGGIGDIPEEILESLSPMGWIAVDDDGISREIYTGTVVTFEEVYQDEGNYLLKLNAEGAFQEEITLTVVQSADVKTIGGIESGDRVRLECWAEDSGYREVKTLTEYQTVSYEYGCANMRLELPAGWAYEIREYAEESDTFGIDFWPEDAAEGKLKLEYYPHGFGVCGTGLEEEQIRLDNGLRAFRGTYDDHDIWDFISIRDLPGSYVVVTENVNLWWDAYETQAMDIIGSMTLAEGIVWENSAIDIARQALKEEFEAEWAKFDFFEEEWIVRFTDQSTTYTVYVGADGTVCNTSVFDPYAATAAKPVIYLYPEEETQVTVKLDFDGRLTTTYPAYNDGWRVNAEPDGTLTDPDTGREYYCLFWEGVGRTVYDMSEGFVVPGEDTEAFLETALSQLGLTDREANEFIIYWLPQMEGNAYNLISFQQEAYTASAELEITPEPDTVLRVFMAWKPLEEAVDIPSQELEYTERTGFTVVEWGGAKVA